MSPVPPSLPFALAAGPPRILTASGRWFHPLAPRAADVAIEDIAHALAHQCRFNGMTSRFYSVAEHSLYASRLCDPADALWGLLHDAAEAYLGDLISPVKALAALAGFRDREQAVLAAVAEAIGLCLPIPSSVRAADAWLLQLELRELLPMPDEWTPEWPPEAARLLRWAKLDTLTPDVARHAFLQRFEALTHGTPA